MNTQIKNFLTIAALTGTVFITACVAKDKTTNNINGLTASGDPVSGNAVSHGVVSGSTVKREVASGSTISGSSIMTGKPSQDVSSKKRTKNLLAEIKKQRYANDYNIYESDKLDGIYQYSLKGKEENFYDTGGLSLPEIVWVDNDCIIYYCEYDDEDVKPKFFYAPITEKEGRRKVQTAKKIKLDCGTDYNAFIAKRNNIIYFVKDKKIHSLDIKTKSIRKLDTDGISVYGNILLDYNYSPCIQDEKAYFIGTDRYFYEFDLTKFSIRKINYKIPYEPYDLPSIILDGKNIYFPRENKQDDTPEDFVKISLKNGRETVLAQGSVLRQLIKQFNPWHYDNSYFESITMAVKYNDRIYLDVNLGYDIKSDVYFETGHMLFNCPADGTDNDITYEKEFTECPEIKPYLTEDIDDEWRELNGTFVSTVGNNEFVIETYDGNNTFDETGNKYFILYDIATNSTKRFEHDSLEYCLITAKGYTEYEELDGRHF